MDEKDLKDLKKDFDNIEVPHEIDFTIEKAIRKAKKEKTAWRTIVPTAAAVVLICSSVLIYRTGFKSNSYFAGVNSSSGADKQNKGYVVSNLPVLGSYDNLIKLLGSSIGRGGLYGAADGAADSAINDNSSKGITERANGTGAPVANSAQKDALGKNDYSTTNVQVEGIDEADEVKTDGQYIYKVNRENLYIIKAYPKEEISVVKTISLKNNTGSSQLFFEDNKLVVITSYYGNYASDAAVKNATPESAKIMPGYITNQTVKITVYDVSDKSNIKTLREAEIQGSLSSARMIKGTVYIVGNKGINYYGAREGNKPDDKAILPQYKDGSFTNGGYALIPYDKISYCPEAVSPNFIVVASINLNKLDESMKVTSCVGSAQNLYMSEKNLYVSGYGSSARLQQSYSEITTIYKFSLNDGTVKYEATGEVPGYLISQFSMDESGEYFRVATTKSSFDQGISAMDNRIYVLDKDMKVYGKLEALAKGERIYSTRFMGNRLYMVTFKNTDPLFVIDMADPKSPKVLGELKIPGFSNYLHPYDENHIMGFGMDTVLKDVNGVERVMQTGMKVAMFDVSDVNNPKQQFIVNIGEAGTYSELLYNHKALLFSKEKGILAFPIDVMETRKDAADRPYPTPAFQGLYVYKVDLSNGFSLKGRITHMSGDALQKDPYQKDAGEYDSRVDRSLYINDVLYSFSNKYVKANSLNSLEELKTLKLQ